MGPELDRSPKQQRCHDNVQLDRAQGRHELLHPATRGAQRQQRLLRSGINPWYRHGNPNTNRTDYTNHKHNIRNAVMDTPVQFSA